MKIMYKTERKKKQQMRYPIHINKSIFHKQNLINYNNTKFLPCTRNVFKNNVFNVLWMSQKTFDLFLHLLRSFKNGVHFYVKNTSKDSKNIFPIPYRNILEKTKTSSFSVLICSWAILSLFDEDEVLGDILRWLRMVKGCIIHKVLVKIVIYI